MRKFLLAFILLIWKATLLAQFHPGPVLPADSTALFKELKSRVRVSSPNASEEYLKRLAKINDERFTELREGVEDSLYLFHPELQNYLDKLMAEIVRANNLEVDPLVLIRRSHLPNAASLGGAVFTVNLGLFKSMETSDEIAFVLCHEMAHDQLKHQEESTLEFCQRSLDMESVTEQLNKRRTKKSQKQRLIAGARETVYNSYRLRRQNELAADSLGLQYYTSLQYSMEAVAEALVNLRNSWMLDLTEVDYKSLLQTEAYPLKEKWMEEPAQMFGGSFGSDEAPGGFWEKDSMSTHPEISARQEGLVELLPLEKVDTSVMEQAHEFGLIASQETIRAQTECGTPGLAIINGLKLLATEPDNPTFRALLGEALLGTYRSIEEHNFDEAVPPEGYFWDENSRMIIRMFHQMRKSELQKFILAWIRERSEGMDNNAMTAVLKKAEIYFSSLE